MADADYDPIWLRKGSHFVIARSPRELAEYQFDGYVLEGSSVPDNRRRPARLVDVDVAAANLNAGITRGRIETDYQKRVRDGLVATRNKLGPVSTDFTAVSINVASNPAYNRAYTMVGQANGSELPASWPADMGEGVNAWVSGQHIAYGSQTPQPRSMRVMHDGDAFCWRPTGAHDFMVYIDGRPTSLTPYNDVNAAAHFNEITFPSAKTRLIEIRTWTYIGNLYAKKPYNLWRPPPRRGPRVLAFGDSYTTATGSTTGRAMDSIYWNMGPLVGTEDFWLDGVGGTGYGVTSAADGSGTGNRYLDRLERLITVPWRVADIKPDVVVGHGGGANDRYKGRTVAQIIADVVTVFTNLRATLPDAKLVFVEGFAPPTGFSTFNPDYIAIRQGAQAALEDIGVYYIDVATSSPWIKGTGWVGATTGVDNSDIYISGDQIHPSTAGHLYIRNRIAQKVQRAMLDDGSLLNTLI